MTGPKTLRDVASGDLGDALLQAARSEIHDDSAVERTLIALSLAASVTALGGASVAKAAVGAGAASAGVGAAGVGGAGTLGAGSVSTGGAAASAMTKGALVLTVSKWFGATAIAGGAALGGMQLWERSHDASTAQSVASNTSTNVRGSSEGATHEQRSAAAETNNQSLTAPPEQAAPDSVTQVPTASALNERSSVTAQPALAVRVNPGRDNGARAGVSPELSPALNAETPPAHADISEVSAARGLAADSARASNPGLPTAALPANVSESAVPGAPQNIHSEPAVLPMAPPVELKANAQQPRRGATLGLEVRSIDAVRERLKAGDAAQALSLLVKHRARFGSGALGPEALFLQMDAERALGRRAAAMRTARQILERFPKGPSAESARQLLGE